jgi:hypothetical protein
MALLIHAPRIGSKSRKELTERNGCISSIISNWRIDIHHCPRTRLAPNRNSSNPTNLHHLYRLAPGESQKLDGGGGVRNRPGGPGWIPSSHRAIAAGSLLTPGDGLCVRSVAKPTEFVGTNSALLHWGATPVW